MDPYDELDAPVLPPSAAVLAMRKNYKMLGISQFVGLFSLHVTSIDFIIEVSHSPPFSAPVASFLSRRTFWRALGRVRVGFFGRE